MNLVLRLLAVLLGLLRGGRLAPLGTSVLRFRVLPNDLDYNLHMNNGRYLSIMDLGRVDLMGRQGVIRELVRRGWWPVVGSLTIRFRRSLEPFDRYELHTRLVAWDERWLYLEQRFLRRGEVAAVALVKGVFLGPDGRVPPQRLLELVDPGLTSPPVPDAVAEWQRAEELLRAGDPDRAGV